MEKELSVCFESLDCRRADIRPHLDKSRDREAAKVVRATVHLRAALRASPAVARAASSVFPRPVNLGNASIKIGEQS